METNSSAIKREISENVTTPVANNHAGNDDKLHLIKGQIEYYLSDENLKKDKFFHEKISSDPDGYLEVDLIMNCNKIKNLNCSKDDIINSIKLSGELELSGDKVRRVGNKALPQLKFLNKKTNRKDSEDDDEKDDDKEEAKSFDPIILEVSSDKEPDFKWKTIQDKFKELNPGLKVIYLRFNKDKGHIGVYNSKDSLNFSDNFTIEGVTFKVAKCVGDELISFWKDHGNHFEMCIGKSKKFDKKGRKDRKKKDTTSLKHSVTLGNEKFVDVTQIKSRARKILTLNKDGEKVSSPDHEFIYDLLKYHRNFEEKTKDLSYFTTGKPSEHDYSRCFFIVRNDDSKEDFSIHKCIDKLAIENKKKK